MIAGRPDFAEDTTLPKGWEAGVLEDYIERPEYGFTDSASDDPLGTKFLRITDIQDGQVDWNTVPYCNCPSDVVASKRLLPGDVVVARIGATTGKSFFIDSPPHEAVFASYLIRLRTRPAKLLPRFLYFYMHTTAYWAHVDRHKGDRLKGGVNIPVLESLPVVVPPIEEQTRLIRVLDCVHAAARSEATQAVVSAGLKDAALSTIFRRGLRSEPQTETDIGLLPESWNVKRLSEIADVLSTRMSYSDLEVARPSSAADAVPVLGIKVSDMNRAGNEVELRGAALTTSLDRSIAEHRGAPPGTIIFPKRGAAIATNKKRLSTTWTVFDPNVIGVRARAGLDQRFLFHWFQEFDLRTITEPGPTPQLNKKNLEPLLVPVPSNLDDQTEIAGVLDAIDRKIDLHRRKNDVLEELFTALLHKLMTGQMRVDQLNLSALSHREVTA